jgi:hypothetical protein
MLIPAIPIAEPLAYTGHRDFPLHLLWSPRLPGDVSSWTVLCHYPRARNPQEHPYMWPLSAPD